MTLFDTYKSPYKSPHYCVKRSTTSRGKSRQFHSVKDLFCLLILTAARQKLYFALFRRLVHATSALSPVQPFSLSMHDRGANIIPYFLA